jgi:hypothetical protein
MIVRIGARIKAKRGIGRERIFYTNRRMARRT